MQLTNLHEYTDRQVFGFIVAHLLKQNAKALSADTVRCQYKNEAGLKCAVGCLIPDDMYHPGMEGSSVETLLQECRIEVSLTRMTMLDVLQHVHDEDAVEDWPRVLDEVEKDFFGELQ